MADWRILVTDDEPYVVMAIRELLETLPAMVMEATSGEEALRIVRADRPDLVLLDIKMPGLDGFQVAEALKKDPATSAIPIVFLSALGSSKEKVRGLELGAEDYLTKPINKIELLTRIRAVLKLKHEMDSSKKIARQLEEAHLHLQPRQQRQRSGLRRDGVAAARVRTRRQVHPRDRQGPLRLGLCPRRPRRQGRGAGQCGFGRRCN